ncbi:MAG: (d)CMP kinase [Eubacteriales bacterium]|nr:(d)CMP kinase [Eubacteriales bacterium]
MRITIAIDGPVGAGKSTVADGVAKELGILHLDTGAMYRAFAWKALQEGVDLENEAALEALTRRVMPEVRYENGAQRTLIDGDDVTGLIRTPEVSMAASNVSKVAAVRAAMVARQQQLAAQQSMLLDGRDIGTRVLPDAMIKIYLTASSEVRAKRRFEEQVKKGDDTPYEEVLKDVVRRDEQDMNREVDPLRPAQDAQIVDSSDFTQQQVVESIVRRVRLKQGVKPEREEKFTPMYRFVKMLAGFLFSTFFPVRYHNEENLQWDAPYILLANHNCMMDPLVIAWKCHRYHVRFLGKKELVKNPIARWFFRKMLMISVDRHHMDMSAIRQCLKTLKEKHVLGIFPEGTRHKTGVMEELESGVAMIALMGKVPLIPVYMTGKPRLFRPIDVYYGQPILTSSLAAKGVTKENCDELLQEVRAFYSHIIALHPSLVKKG